MKWGVTIASLPKGMRFIQCASLHSIPGKAQCTLTVVPAVLGPMRACRSESPTQGGQAALGPSAGHSATLPAGSVGSTSLRALPWPPGALRGPWSGEGQN